MGRRAIVTADVHVEGRADTTSRRPTKNPLTKFSRLFDDIQTLAVDNKAEDIYILGDLWHEKHGVNVDCLTLIHSKLSQWKKAGLRVTLLRGNHEIEVKSSPHTTLLSLFGDVATVVNRPLVKVVGETTISLVPWYLHKTYKAAIEKVVKLAKSKGRPTNLLMTHIGIDEGVMSSSNYYRVPQKIRLADLHLKFFDLVMAGDYHLTQQYENFLYLGRPFPGEFGDEPSQGVWLLDYEGARLVQLDLPSSYPNFIDMQIQDGYELSQAKKKIGTQDWYKLKVPASLRAEVQDVARLPNVAITTYARAEDRRPVTERRVKESQEGDWVAYLETWVMALGLEEIYLTEGKKVISKSKERLFSRG